MGRPRGRWSARAGILAALFFAALTLRPQVVGVGPLLPRIGDGLDVSHAVAGLLGTIPVVCMGLFAPPAPVVGARLGTRAAIAGCLAAIAGFGLLRAIAPSAALVLLLTFPIGIGMGLAGALLPVAVKERFADRPAFATGVYATGINLGAAVASALAVPLAGALGGWRGALAGFSVAAGALCLLWLVLTRRGTGDRARGTLPRMPLGRPVVWILVMIFGLLGIIFYGLVSWVPDAFQERGWSEGSAGALVAVLSVAGVPASLVVPWLADRHGSRRAYLLGASGAMLVALVGIAAVPAGGFAWAVLAGASIGVMFPLSLTLPLDVADRPADVGAVAGLMLGAGYVIAALGPLALGALRDLTGSFSLSLWVLVGAAFALVLACAPLSPARLRERSGAQLAPAP